MQSQKDRLLKTGQKFNEKNTRRSRKANQSRGSVFNEYQTLNEISSWQGRQELREKEISQENSGPMESMDDDKKYFATQTEDAMDAYFSKVTKPEAEPK